MPFPDSPYIGKSKVPEIGSEEFNKITKERIKRHNELSKKYYNDSPTKDSKFIFGTYEEALLWTDEFLGQISDGKYENSAIRWEDYNAMKVEVREGEKTRIEGIKPHKSLRFTDLMWLFDGDRAFDRPKSVRAIFSKVSDNELRGYIEKIEKALRQRK